MDFGVIKSLVSFSLRKTLGIFASFATLFSGMFWHISAKNQLDAMTATEELAKQLTYLSIQSNLWAAYCAVFAGLCLSFTLFFEVSES
jgi:hypothetical protein